MVLDTGAAPQALFDLPLSELDTMWRSIDAWTGLLVPSVDRVGRYFPLTLALPLPVFALSDAIWNQSWYAELERIALSALRVDCALDAFEDAIAGNPLTLDSRTGPSPLALHRANRTGPRDLVQE